MYIQNRQLNVYFQYNKREFICFDMWILIHSLKNEKKVIF